MEETNRKSKSFPKGKGKGRYNSKPKPMSSKGTESKFEEATRFKHNDPKWYIVGDQLAKDVASFSFNNQLGTPIRLNGFTTGMSNVSLAIPGIAVIHTAPCVGRSSGGSDATAPVNIAANKIYSFIRHENSGHANYDPNTLMLYFQSMDSVYIMYSWMVRIYGTCMLYSQTNRYVGDVMIKAMGVDPDSIRANLANFRAFINMFAVKANAFAVPNTMSYFLRHSWMYSNIYRDENVSKSQFYMYNPAYLYSYEVDSVSGKPYLMPRDLALTEADDGHLVPRTLLMSYEDIARYANTLLTKLIAQEDLGIMSGDVLKAYKDQGLIKLAELSPDYRVAPVFSEEVLLQIHNTNFVGGYPMSIAEDTYQYGLAGLIEGITEGVGYSAIVFNPTFDDCKRLAYTNIFDTWKEDPTPEDVLVGSRNMMTATLRTIEVGGQSKVVCDLDSAGSELAFFMTIYTFDSNGAYASTNFFLASTIAGYQNILGSLSRFNEYPHVLRFDNDSPSLYLGEISNYTTMDRNNINNLHTSALLAMFGVDRK